MLARLADNTHYVVMLRCVRSDCRNEQSYGSAATMAAVSMVAWLIFGAIGICSCDDVLLRVFLFDRYGMPTSLVTDGVVVRVECSVTKYANCDDCVLAFLPSRNGVPEETVVKDGVPISIASGRVYNLTIDQTFPINSEYRCFVVRIDSNNNIIGEPISDSKTFIFPSYKICPNDGNCSRPSGCSRDAPVYCYYTEIERRVECDKFIHPKTCDAAHDGIVSPYKVCASKQQPKDSLCRAVPLSPRALLSPRDICRDVEDTGFVRTDTGKMVVLGDYVEWNIDESETLPVGFQTLNTRLDVILACSFRLTNGAANVSIESTNANDTHYALRVDQNEASQLALASGDRVAQLRCEWAKAQFYVFVVIFGGARVTISQKYNHTRKSQTLPLAVTCKAFEPLFNKSGVVERYTWTNEDTMQEVGTDADFVVKVPGYYTCTVLFTFVACSPYRRKIRVAYQISANYSMLGKRKHEISIETGWYYFVAAALTFVVAAIVVVLVYFCYKPDIVDGQGKKKVLFQSKGPSTSSESEPTGRSERKRGSGQPLEQGNANLMGRIFGSMKQARKHTSMSEDTLYERLDEMKGEKR